MNNAARRGTEWLWRIHKFPTLREVPIALSQSFPSGCGVVKPVILNRTPPCQTQRLVPSPPPILHPSPLPTYPPSPGPRCWERSRRRDQEIETELHSCLRRLHRESGMSNRRAYSPAVSNRRAHNSTVSNRRAHSPTVSNRRAHSPTVSNRRAHSPIVSM